MKSIQLLSVVGLLTAALAEEVRGQSGFGNGLAFTNTSQYVSITNFGNIIPNNEVTVEFWANLEAASDNSVFVLQPDQYPTNRFAGILRYADNNTYWECGNVGSNGLISAFSPAESIGTWIHYAFVASKSGNYMAMYKNGTLVRTNSGMSPFSQGTYELRIGGFVGGLNDFRVWNTARSQTQISNSLGAPLVGNEAGLVAYYRLNSTNGLVATNSATTGQIYNGTLTGNPTWATGPYGATAPALGTTVRGTVYPGSTATRFYFQYGTTTNYGSTTVVGTVNPVAAFNVPVAVSNALSGLTAGTLYHYRLIVSNSLGVVTGQDGALTPGAGTWTPVATTIPDDINQIMLLSDATVLAHGADSNWYRLTPDPHGDYAKGTWTKRASSSFTRLFMSSVVLADGRVFVGGGEYGSGSNNVEMYNPSNDTWTVVVNPTSFGNILDGHAVLLSDGRVLVEPQGATGNNAGKTFVFNPANNTFSQTTGAPLNGIGEATWVKLANDNILVVDSANSSSGATTAEMYIPSFGTWSNAVISGTVPNIWPNVVGSGSVSEMGPALLLPDGRAIFFGGNGVTALYNNGAWSQGATIPNGLGMKDAGGAMMNNGKILLAVCPQGNNSSANDINGIAPLTFYEFDYTANAGAGGYTLIPGPGLGSALDGMTAAGIRFVDLPDGGILVCGFGGQCHVYKPAGTPLSAGKPRIYSVSQNGDGSLHLTGTLLNGISQGSSYGDDAQMDSNFPLVRFIDTTGTVRYGKTYNWSRTSVATGTNVLSTDCTMPSGASNEDAIQVVANGIASDAVVVNYAEQGITWVDFNYAGGGYNGNFPTPYNTIATGVAGVSSGGLMVIKASSTTAAIRITKTMRIAASGGTAHIGQ